MNEKPQIVESVAITDKYVTILMNKAALVRIIQGVQEYLIGVQPSCYDTSCTDCNGDQTVYGEVTSVLDGLISAKHSLEGWRPNVG